MRYETPVRAEPQDVQQAYPCATESPTPFWADVLSLSRAWFAENLGRPVEGFHLEDESGNVIGLISRSAFDVLQNCGILPLCRAK